MRTYGCSKRLIYHLQATIGYVKRRYIHETETDEK